MAKKQYDLKQILSNEAYKDVETYLSPKLSNGEDNVFYGVDGFAMAGLKGYQSVGISKVVQMLQNLADPKFINLRETWGDNYAETNKLVENVAAYADGKHNAFALQNNESNLAYLSMPLAGNRMSASRGYENLPLQGTWAGIKANLESTLGTKIIEDANLEIALEKKNAQNSDEITLIKKEKGVLGTVKSAAKKLLSPAVLIKNKVTGQETSTSNVANKFDACLVSRTFRDQELSDAEKFLSVVDAFNHENVKVFVKKDKYIKKLLNGVDDVSKRKMLYAAQVTADLFAALASNLGTENHKQIENALKLEVAGVLGSLEDKSYNATRIYALVSECLTAALLKDLNLNPKTIVENRRAMGINYVDEFEKDSNGNTFYTLEQVMFGRTINKSFSLKQNAAVFTGESPVFAALQPFAEEVQTPQPAPAPAPTPAPQPAPAPAPVPQPAPQPVKPTDPQTLKDDLVNVDPISGVVSANGVNAQPQPTQEENYDDIADYEAYQGSSSYILTGKPTKTAASHSASTPSPAPQPTSQPAPAPQAASAPQPVANTDKLYRLHGVPPCLREAYNLNNFESEEVQETLACLQDAMKSGKVVIQQSPFAKALLKHGNYVEPYDMFAYYAVNQAAQVEVDKKLHDIYFKYNVFSPNDTQRSTGSQPVESLPRLAAAPQPQPQSVLAPQPEPQPVDGKNVGPGGIHWIDEEPEPPLEDGEKIVDWINTGELKNVNDEVNVSSVGIDELVDKTLQKNAEELAFVKDHSEFLNNEKYENSKNAELNDSLKFVDDRRRYLRLEEIEKEIKEENKQIIKEISIIEEYDKLVHGALLKKGAINANRLKSVLDARQNQEMADESNSFDTLTSGDEKLAFVDGDTFVIGDKNQPISVPVQTQETQEIQEKTTEETKKLSDLIAQTQVARKEEMFKTTAESQEEQQIIQMPELPFLASQVEDATETQEPAVNQEKQYMLAMPYSFYRAQRKQNFKTKQMQEMLGVLHSGLESKELFVAPIDNNKFAYFATTKETAKKYNVLLNKIYWNYEYWKIAQRKKQTKEAKQLKENAKELQFVVDYADYLAEQNQPLENAKHLAFVVGRAEYLKQKNAEKQTVNAIKNAAVNAQTLGEEIAKKQNQQEQKNKLDEGVKTARNLASQVNAELAKLEAQKIEEAQKKSNKRKTSASRTRSTCSKNKKKTLHVWKDGHFDYI